MPFSGKFQELPSLREDENVQKKERLQFISKTIASEGRKPFNSRMDVSESFEATTNHRPSVNSKKLEQVQEEKDRENITITLGEGESFSRELGTNRKKTSNGAKIEKAPQSTSKQYSDSEDEDIESWLEFTYDHGEKSSEDAIESNTVFQTTSLSAESFRKHPKPDFPEGGKAIRTPDVGANIEAVDSETGMICMETSDFR